MKLDDEAAAALQSILYACTQSSEQDTYLAAASGLTVMRSKRGTLGVTALSVLTAARAGGLWRRFCSEPPSLVTVAEIMGYGHISTPLRQSLLDALTGLVAIWEAYRPGKDIRVVLADFDAVMERFAVEQPIHGTEFLFTEQVMLTARLVSLGAMQRGLTEREFLDVDLAA